MCVLSSDEVNARQQPFPSLKQCFEEIDEMAGFNIELKYPLLMQVSLIECTLLLEFLAIEFRNDFLLSGPFLLLIAVDKAFVLRLPICVRYKTTCLFETAPQPHTEGQVVCLESLANWHSM